MKQEELLKNLETITKISKIILQYGIALGVLVTILYCGKIDYYPAGLTVGDTLFFIAVSLSTVFTYTLLVLALFCAGITFSPFLRWIQRAVLSIKFIREKLRDKETGEVNSINFPPLGSDKFTIAIVGFIIFLGIILILYKDFDKGMGLAFTVLTMSFFYGLWNTTPKNITNERTEFKVKVVLAGLIFSVPLLVSHSQENVLMHAMRLIGVRYEHANVQVSEKYQEYLTYHKVTADALTSKKDGFYNDVTVLFKGIGEYTVLEIKGIKVTVPNKEAIVGK